jgi:hypothetical protein
MNDGPAISVFVPACRIDLSTVRINSATGDWRPGDLAEVMVQRRLTAEAVALHDQAGRPAILVYACNAVHLRVLSAGFRIAGIPTLAIDVGRPAAEFRTAFDNLVTGRIGAVVTDRPYTAGPPITGPGTILLARPTRSKAMFLSFLERFTALALIVDVSGNVALHGAPPEWETRVTIGPAQDVVADPILDRLTFLKARELQKWAAGDRMRLELAAKAKGYNAGWIQHSEQAWGGRALQDRNEPINRTHDQHRREAATRFLQA